MSATGRKSKKASPLSVRERLVLASAQTHAVRGGKLGFVLPPMRGWHFQLLVTSTHVPSFVHYTWTLEVWTEKVLNAFSYTDWSFMQMAIHAMGCRPSTWSTDPVLDMPNYVRKCGTRLRWRWTEKRLSEHGVADTGEVAQA
jgi:hypothetical protein